MPVPDEGPPAAISSSLTEKEALLAERLGSRQPRQRHGAQPRVTSVVATVTRALRHGDRTSEEPPPHSTSDAAAAQEHRGKSRLCHLPAAEVERLQVHRLVTLQINLEGEEAPTVELTRPDALPPDAARQLQKKAVTLQDSERLLGFRWWEQPDPEMGGMRYYDPWVLVMTGHGEARLESLAGELALPLPEMPGKERWLPAEAGQEDLHHLVSLKRLRTMQGKVQTHIMGSVFMSAAWQSNEAHLPLKETPMWRIRRFTGAQVLFWVELLVFDLFFYYLDVATDLQQLFVVFWLEGKHAYFYVFTSGILVSMLVTLRAVAKWLEAPSREVDWLRLHLPRHTVPLALVVAICLVVTQTHVLVLVAFSAYFRVRHPLLQSAKKAEALEAAVAATVLTAFFIASPPTNHWDVVTSVLALASSLCSLGLGFASRDRVSGKVLGLRGRLDGWGLDVLSIWALRTVEVASRLLCFSIIHGWFGGTHVLHLPRGIGLALARDMFVMGFVMLFIVWAFFRPYASFAEALAGILAHPGQLAESSSVLPIGRSVAVHAGLAAVASAAQGLAWTTPAGLADAFPAAKAAPLWAWSSGVASTCLALGGLLYYWCFPPRECHPALEGASVDGVLHLTRLGRLLGKTSTPALSSLVKGCGKTIVLDVGAYRQLRDTLKAGGSARAGTSPHYMQVALESLPLLISLPFARLQRSEWKELAELLPVAAQVHEAHLDECFQSNRLLRHIASAVEHILRVLGGSRGLRKLSLRRCKAVPGSAWASWRDAEWPDLEEVDLSRCFEDDTGNEGVVPALRALATSRRLRRLLLSDCTAIPADAWEALDLAQWAELEEVRFDRCRFSGGAARSVLGVLSRCTRLLHLDLSYAQGVSVADWAVLEGAKWPELRVAKLQGCSFRASAPKVLGALAECHTLQVLDLHWCLNISGDSWEVLHNVTWPELQRADFNSCFSASSEGVLSVLTALGHSRRLEELDLADNDIPPEAWEAVPDAAWPVMRSLFSGPSPPLSDAEKARICQGSGFEITSGASTLAVYSGHEREIDVQDWETAALQRGRELWELHALDGCEQDALFFPAMHAAGLAKQLLVLNLSGCKRLPTAAWPALRGSHLRKVDLTECFLDRGDGAKDALKALATCHQLEDLGLERCQKIGAAWWAVSAARWPQLRRATLDHCFEEDGLGAECILGLLAGCGKLEEVSFQCCGAIGAAWSALAHARWTELRRASFTQCFLTDPAGAETVVSVLKACTKLEELDFRANRMAPHPDVPPGCEVVLRSFRAS